MTNRPTLSELSAEFFGSMLLVTAAVSSMLLFTATFESTKSIAVLANAITVAFVLCALIEIFAPISGAHFNPVVTMIMAFEKRIGAAKFGLYIFVQIAGGVTGTLLARLMFLEYVGSMLAISDTARSHTYIGEIIGTFFLILAILLLVKAGSSKIPLTIGLLVGGQIMATSSTMFANPQVTIARMFTNSPAGIRPLDGALFIAMQLIGALLAYAVYRFIFAKSTQTEEIQ